MQEKQNRTYRLWWGPWHPRGDPNQIHRLTQHLTSRGLQRLTHSTTWKPTRQKTETVHYRTQHTFRHTFSTPTFYHHNGRNHSHIDYIFYIPAKAATGKQFTLSTYIHAVHQLNTSDHIDITAKIPLLTKKAVETNTKEENSNQGKPFQKPQWGKCHKQLYRETVEKLMLEANINPQVDSNTLLWLEISQLETVLQHATETSIEGHQTHASTNKRRGRGKWNSKIAEASRHSKAVHKKIKESTCK